MEKYKDLLKKCSLFQNMDDESYNKLVNCLSPVPKTYQKGEVVILSGYNVSNIGIVVEGGLQATKESSQGEKILISNIGVLGIIGEMLAGSKSVKSPVTVTAVAPSTVLLISYDKLTNMCENACKPHNTLLKNMIQLISKQFFELHDRLTCLTMRNIRSRIKMYLKDEALKNGADTFSIPYNREELSSYLNIERSALSRELSRMRNENLIDFYKNSFKVMF